MMIEFEIVKSPSGEKNLIIFERGRFETPIVIIEGRDFERLKNAVRE